MVAVVDDDASLRRSVKNLLSSASFQVITFESAEALLAYPQLAQLGCLVLDLRMPGMSGLELLEQLAAQGLRIPTVILTAHAQLEMRERCLSAGATEFMTKPFSADALLAAVTSALAH